LKRRLEASVFAGSPRAAIDPDRAPGPAARFAPGLAASGEHLQGRHAFLPFIE
jgi:hypothetical protein